LIGRKIAPIWAHRESDIEKCRAVLHEHGDDVIRSDPAWGQPAADDPDSFVEIRIGDLLAAVFQRTALRAFGGREMR